MMIFGQFYLQKKKFELQVNKCPQELRFRSKHFVQNV